METDHVLKIIADSTMGAMDEPAFKFVRSLEDQHRLAETIIK